MPTNCEMSQNINHTLILAFRGVPIRLRGGVKYSNFISAKFHDIYFTETQVEYHGSTTLGSEQCRELSILPLQYVDIWNKHSGTRISTYAIYGEPGSFCCTLNNAAARTCQVGDQITDHL